MKNTCNRQHIINSIHYKKLLDKNLNKYDIHRQEPHYSWLKNKKRADANDKLIEIDRGKRDELLISNSRLIDFLINKETIVSLSKRYRKPQWLIKMVIERRIKSIEESSIYLELIKENKNMGEVVTLSSSRVANTLFIYNHNKVLGNETSKSLLIKQKPLCSYKIKRKTSLASWFYETISKKGKIGQIELLSVAKKNGYSAKSILTHVAKSSSGVTKVYNEYILNSVFLREFVNKGLYNSLKQDASKVLNSQGMIDLFRLKEYKKYNHLTIEMLRSIMCHKGEFKRHSRTLLNKI